MVMTNVLLIKTTQRFELDLLLKFCLKEKNNFNDDSDAM